MVGILASFGLATILATFQKIGQFLFHVIWSPCSQLKICWRLCSDVVHFLHAMSYKTFYRSIMETTVLVNDSYFHHSLTFGGLDIKPNLRIYTNYRLL